MKDGTVSGQMKAEIIRRAYGGRILSELKFTTLIRKPVHKVTQPHIMYTPSAVSSIIRCWVPPLIKLSIPFLLGSRWLSPKKDSRKDKYTLTYKTKSVMEELPHNWESGGGSGTRKNGMSDRTFTHWYSNPDPESVSQPSDEQEKRVLSMEVYHDAGNAEYRANMEIRKELLDENGDTIESIDEDVRDSRVVKVEGETASRIGDIVGTHDEAEERIHELAEEMMANNP